MAHVMSRNSLQVIVVGKKVDGEWRYVRGAPVSFDEAMRELKEFSNARVRWIDAVCFARAVDDPEIQRYPTTEEIQQKSVHPSKDTLE